MSSNTYNLYDLDDLAYEANRRAGAATEELVSEMKDLQLRASVAALVPGGPPPPLIEEMVAMMARLEQHREQIEEQRAEVAALPDDTQLALCESATVEGLTTMQQIIDAHRGRETNRRRNEMSINIYSLSGDFDREQRELKGRVDAEVTVNGEPTPELFEEMKALGDRRERLAKQLKETREADREALKYVLRPGETVLELCDWGMDRGAVTMGEIIDLRFHPDHGGPSA